MAKTLFWLWVLFLLLLNVIPVGNETSKALTGNRFVFRLDHLLHLAMILSTAWLFVLGQVMDHPVFNDKPALCYSITVILAAVIFEYAQHLVPSRKFNPLDLLFNLAGAFLGICAVVISGKYARREKKW